MRQTLMVALICVGATCWADREFLTPKGTKLLSNTLRSEGILSLRSPRRSLAYLGAGLGPAIDIEVVSEYLGSKFQPLSLDASYNVFPAVADFSPGISCGFQDLANQTSEGRSVYLAATWRFNMDGDWNQNTPLEFTLGVGVGRFRGAFYNCRLPIADSVRLFAEDDTHALTAGIEVRPTKDLQMKWAMRQSGSFLSVGYSVRF
jgi:hypothetical protein